MYNEKQKVLMFDVLVRLHRFADKLEGVLPTSEFEPIIFESLGSDDTLTFYFAFERVSDRALFIFYSYSDPDEDGKTIKQYERYLEETGNWLENPDILTLEELDKELEKAIDDVKELRDTWIDEMEDSK